MAKTIVVKQIGSPIRRPKVQRQTLIGLGLNKMHRTRELPDTPYSCGQGFCGTCRQRVLAGPVDHRDGLLTDAEQADSMLLCVSRAREERLVLDL